MTEKTKKLSHGSLFSGIGGFDLAAEWAGWQNAFHCEWNEFGQKILKHYWPKAISYGDITKTDFTIHRGTIDVLTGGFPCQPYSLAGKRKGKEDERHLWPEMLRAIREIQPTWVVGENVAGLLSWNGGLVFDEVQADLEAAGYEIQPVILPACSVNAPHKRERIWFIAYNSNARIKGLQFRRENGIYEFEPIANPNSSSTRNEIQTGGHLLASDVFTNANGWGLEERICGELGKPKTNSNAYKLYNCNEWANFPTQSPICSGNDGISGKLDGITFPKWRNESIKAYGNAIVPQVAYQIFKAINEYEGL